MKKYYVHYYNNFANTYTLYYTDDAHPASLLPKDAQHITRKEAFKLCAKERRAHKENPSFAGYGAAYIVPAGYSDGDATGKVNGYFLI